MNNKYNVKFKTKSSKDGERVVVHSYSNEIDYTRLLIFIIVNLPKIIGKGQIEIEIV